MTFPSIDSAAQYVKERLQTFYDQSRVLKDRLLTIGRLMQEARKRNDQGALGQLIILQQQTKDTFIEQLALEQKLSPFASYFGISTALGALPIVLGVAAISVATALYLHLGKIKNQEKALDLIAKGFLTPAEAEKILAPSFFGGLGGAFMMPLILIGGAALLFFGGFFKRA